MHVQALQRFCMRVVGSFAGQCSLPGLLAMRTGTGLESLAGEGNGPVRASIVYRP